MSAKQIKIFILRNSIIAEYALFSYFLTKEEAEERKETLVAHVLEAGVEKGIFPPELEKDGRAELVRSFLQIREYSVWHLEGEYFVAKIHVEKEEKNGSSN